MRNTSKIYIGGQWVQSIGTKTLEVINPATEKVIATIALGTQEDVNNAISAANAAFDGFTSTSREGRIELLENVIKEDKRRLRTGMVRINGATLDARAPFGGYKQSGNGREFSEHGLLDFLEFKSIFSDRSEAA
jgi:acyl-CoA reductase-like NAD-dependent aldehyde dehydrogenase